MELQETEFERDTIAATASTLDPEPPVSGWCWLLPPVYWQLSRRRSRRQRDAVFMALTPDQREQFAAFMAKAFGWSMVATGAFFIALK
ncbi:hypothetical protein [Nocardioides sp. Soil796]|uniref:hypothetical protein n=1 Tax=Nocardioides sp. Soil796 TaxID=1736412 RepID=UPI00070E83EB|nr:hypothetical protein [Nocardioides sp. Soil796]KRF19907.1 hypothetical protein ASH02_23005 [Nocardioides sp. Soil796]